MGYLGGRGQGCATTAWPREEVLTIDLDADAYVGWSLSSAARAQHRRCGGARRDPIVEEDPR